MKKLLYSLFEYMNDNVNIPNTTNKILSILIKALVILTPSYHHMMPVPLSSQDGCHKMVIRGG